MDTWVETGTDVTPFYDSLLGKLMVHGSSRADAIAKMSKALAGTVLGGIPSNLEYLRTIIASEGYHAGKPKQSYHLKPYIPLRTQCRSHNMQTSYHADGKGPWLF